MINWFKKLFYIVKNFDDIVDAMTDLGRNQVQLKFDVDDAVQTIKDRTTLHADISHVRRNGHVNQLIMIGRYRNRDYIETFEVLPDDFAGLVRQCREMQRYAHLSKVDAPLDMKEIIETDSVKYWGIS